jgi:hypothetical protein
MVNAVDRSIRGRGRWCWREEWRRDGGGREREREEGVKEDSERGKEMEREVGGWEGASRREGGRVAMSLSVCS